MLYIYIVKQKQQIMETMETKRATSIRVGDKIKRSCLFGTHVLMVKSVERAAITRELIIETEVLSTTDDSARKFVEVGGEYIFYPRDKTRIKLI